ncbi:MAG: LysM peptidoglycan-binding domain-containing protein [Akkermansia sp.]|nr:LysM peptidoglycan-binding domain-containing protein [Akkermansia sp.]
MKKDAKATFRNSDLGRAKPKRHFIKTFVDDNLKQKRLHSDIGMVEDRTSPAAVLRIIFGLIIVHILVIGGVMLRGNIAKSNSGLAVMPSLTPPPAVPAQEAAPAAVAPAQPAPVQPVVTTTAPQTAPSAPAQQNEVHITQAPINMEAVTAAPATQPATPAEPVAVQATPAPAAPAVPTVDHPHHIRSGDTWGRIAAQYGITEDVLKAANPSMAERTNLPAGAYLTVKIPADSPAAKALEAAKPVVKDTAKYHIVKRGENLGRIARKYKISLSKLLQLNDMTNADAKRLRVGHKLKVSE